MKTLIETLRPLVLVLLCLTLSGGLLAPRAGAQDTEPPETQPTSEATPADLPPAEEIIASYIEATGGEELQRSHEFMTTKGTFSVPAAGLEGPMVVYQAAPNKQYTEVTIPGVGVTREGFDGTVAWSINAMTGPQLKEGEELEQARREADILGMLNYKEHYETVETTELTEFAGQEAYEVTLTPKSGDAIRSYFSKETGLHVGSRITAQTAMGPIQVVAEIRGYQDFDGIKIPTEIVQSMMMQQQVIRITDVSFDEIDPAVFELPDEVKALLPGDDEDDEGDDEGGEMAPDDEEDDGGGQTPPDDDDDDDEE